MLKQDVVQIVPQRTKPRRALFNWLRTWELYLIVLVAGFLRFYALNTTEFDQDQAILFRMARDAFVHGLLPTTSNTASIGIAHPAGVIYLFILPALLNPDPLGGAILVALCSLFAVLLTYFFTRRYYGRLAGIVAALLYATAYRPLLYARFIWQPNLMPPFVLLFLFALFYGVVERRRGWLLPALVLLGILYQMHEVTILLAIPLAVALLLAPRTIRLRDILFAGIGLAIIFFPYLLWQVYTHFTDLHTVLTLARQHSRIDGQALHFYQIFLDPNVPSPTDNHVLPYSLTPLYSWLQYVMPVLVILGLLTVVAALVAPMFLNKTRPAAENEHTSIRQRLANVQADTHRCGLIVLLAWQVVPLLILSRHAIDLHSQYFFLLLPGPFILIGIFFTHIIMWLQKRHDWLHHMRVAFYGLAFLLIAAQMLSSTGWLLDTTNGNSSNDTFSPYHNDLRSLKQALNDADTLAQTHSLHRVYIATDDATQTALDYLSIQMRTPTTLFDASHCLVLPNPAEGPAVLLVSPHNPLTTALAEHFASATRVSTPSRLGGAPFYLYLVSSLPQQAGPKDALFGNDLQLLTPSAQTLQVAQSSWRVTRWTLLRPQTPRPRTNYGYVMIATHANTIAPSTSICTFNSIAAGDELLVAFPTTKNTSTTAPLNVEAKSFMQVPFNPTYGIFHMETDTAQDTPWVGLLTPSGKNTVQVS